ncbi:MAG: hypothetical protein AB7R90_19455 [Reyranellaceae bacterium]
MPTPLRETIAAAIATRLATVPGAPEVRRNPDTMATAGNAIDFHEGGQDVLEQQPAATRYGWTIELELFHTPGPAINELYAQALKHLLDPAWWPEGMTDLREDSLGATQLDREEGHDSLAGYLLTLTVEYWTASQDPFVAAP